VWKQWKQPLNSPGVGVMNAGIVENKARIIAFENNFHGRTSTVISFSSDPSSFTGFGPLCPDSM
jgi:ornithine--oxo-acid transaminase